MVTTGSDPGTWYREAFGRPIALIQDAPEWSRRWGVVGAVIQALAASGVLIPMVAIGALMLFSMADYLLGTRIADLTGEYDEHKARAGLLGKAATVALCVLVVVLEWTLAYVLTGVPRVGEQIATLYPAGIVGAGIAIVVSIGEVDSFDRRVESLTGRPTPLLRPFLNALRSIVLERLLPGRPE